MSLRLLVGLGNPGAQYAKTRHNVGAWLLAALAKKFDLNFRHEAKFFGSVAQLSIDNQVCYLFVPSTYMNESGRGIEAIMNFYKIPAEEVLIAHDELDFPAGVARLKIGGGHGGHNGLRDTIRCIGSNFYRVRIGIDHPGHRDQVTPYVLGEPSKGEAQKIMQSIEDVITVIDDIVSGNIEKAYRFLHNDKDGE